LADVEVFIGADNLEGRSKSLPGGDIRLATPGMGFEAYEATLKGLLHEVGHGVQRRAMGESSFMDRWRSEKNEFGLERTYATPGTLEHGANQFRDDFLAKRARGR
jgi:hypothetical protein